MSDEISWWMNNPISNIIYLYHETRLRYTIPFCILNSVIRAVCKRLWFCTWILAQLTGSSLIVSDSPKSCKGRSVFLPTIPGTLLESSRVGQNVLIGQTWVDSTGLSSVTAPVVKGNLPSTPNWPHGRIFLENLTVAQLVKKFRSEEFYLLGYSTIQSVKNQHKFRRNMSLPFWFSTDHAALYPKR
jgi:hypothetical protein